jgi:hypothetical protein
MTIELGTVIPVLRIFSIEKAQEFYFDFLGPFANKIVFNEANAA